MRLPIKEKGKNRDQIGWINEFNYILQGSFESLVKNIMYTFKTKVMLADFSVIEVVSFDPNKIVKALSSIEVEMNRHSGNWQIVGVQSTKSDDLRRIYLQLSLEIDKYYFYVYMGIQFHSLLYYQANKEVIRLSKKIRELEETNYLTKNEITTEGNKIIREELEKLGYKDSDNSLLFEELFTKNELTQSLIEKASNIEKNYPSIEKNEKTITELKSQLNSFVVEAYQMNLATLDQNKMLQGEEGVVFYIDFEMFKNKKTKDRTSVINFDKIPREIIDKMKMEFDHLQNILNQTN
ncbi:hypothetical protein [Candidatus Nitrosocosmicus sp. SS]|uniref:hypothetical protein n=1 Tax=Candidatus Nitrosocosmicus agrestis TaxID=2563600 RepID=UPI00122DF204|nr:hypothetical protein [Candidatus Nitrosocosmicus sp. SS]KAA2280331.1 hypothetical protein F1Z66_11085 [Candidatus Nitrosocosmicus sp. SS]KAF0867742.1 hypothetical protein E5N71_13690 [Candidatus Nitrosocosmicus sp. SS]MDR4491561.1 hypothetical protein [Candidatus Nitrosocosmicus sp.]